MRKATRLLATALVASVIATAPVAGPASADGAAPAATTALSTIQQDAAASISLRQTTIDQLEALVAHTRYFTGDDQSALDGRLRSDAAGLSTLGGQIASDTLARTAFADYVKVFAQYRIYALVDPVVHFVRATDVLDSAVVPRLTAAQRTLRALLKQEQQGGRDVSAAAGPMKDLGEQIHVVSADTNGLSAKLLAMAPADWNANPAILAQPLSALQGARVAVGRAVQDARAVEAVLQ